MLAGRLARRSFHASCSRSGMNYIGREPIAIPSGVTLTKQNGSILVAGPLGASAIPTDPFIKVEHFNEEDKQYVSIAVEDELVQKQREMWGTTRTLVSNTVEGVSVGFKVPVHLVGVGYRAALETNPRPAPGMSGQRLSLKLGFASQSSAYVPVPIGIQAAVPQPTRIELSGTSKSAIGQFAANIKKLRKPEPYKGKVGRVEHYRLKKDLRVNKIGYLCGHRNDQTQEC